VSALSPAAPLLATGNPNGIVRLWSMTDPRHPTVVATLSGSSAAQTVMTFSPDGEVLVGEDSQSIIHLWDVSGPGSPVTVGTITQSSGPVTVSLPAAPTGGRLAAIATSDGIDLLNISASAIIRRLCAGSGDPVTAAQWHQYVPGLPYETPCAAEG